MDRLCICNPFLNIYYVPGTVLDDLYMLTQFEERLGHLPKVTHQEVAEQVCVTP